MQKEAEALGDTVDPKDLQGRELLFHQRIFTIDGEHSKDFDDAVSIELASNGNWKLGVHIADVSHYVRKGTKRLIARRFPGDQRIPAGSRCTHAAGGGFPMGYVL